LKGKKTTLSYSLVEHHFDDLLHHRFSLIHKATGLSTKMIQELIGKDITPLDTHPGRRFLEQRSQLIIPDISLKKEEDAWVIVINEEPLPQFKVITHCKTLCEQLKPEERPFVQQHLLSAEWLKQLIAQRQETLTRIAQYILKIQEPFFNGDQSTFTPMTVQDVAGALGHHASTISRAISHKHLAFPGGLMALSDLLTHAQSPSKIAAKEKIVQWIAEENKTAPLSDELLSKKLKDSGISCARRSVAKYRHALNIPSALLRAQNK
jgi:RNA polymerase sigma-54 factor